MKKYNQYLIAFYIILILSAGWRVYKLGSSFPRAKVQKVQN